MLVATVLSFAVSLVAALPTQSTVEAPGVTKRTNGLSTIYLQNGGFGSCGNQNPEESFIVALGNAWMNHQFQSPNCGRQIRIRNVGSNDVNVGGNGNEITVTVQDTCESCDANHLDLSLGAWNALTNNSPWSTVNIDWNWL